MYSLEATHGLDEMIEGFILMHSRENFIQYIMMEWEDLTTTNTPTHINSNNPHFRKLYFTDGKTHKIIPSAVSGANKAIEFFKDLDGEVVNKAEKISVYYINREN